MGLDLRWPIGLMFSLIGILLTGRGLMQKTASTVSVGGSDININLVWGLVLVVFGLFMLIMAWRGSKNAPKS